MITILISKLTRQIISNGSFSTKNTIKIDTSFDTVVSTTILPFKLSRKQTVQQYTEQLLPYFKK